MRPKFGGGFEGYTKKPSVVVENSKGETRRVAAFNTFQAAKDGVVTIENDFKTLGPAAWCERYGVPPAFVS